jgi:hypothetical protein
MTDTEREMRRLKRDEFPCRCGRMTTVHALSGCEACALCCAEAARAWWQLYEGEITAPGFYRRLRRVFPHGNNLRG